MTNPSKSTDPAERAAPVTANLNASRPADSHKWIEEMHPVEELALARRRSRRFALGLAVALGMGIVIGVFTARQRAHARQVIASINGTVLTQDAFYQQLEKKDGVEVLQKMASDTLQQQYAQSLHVAPTEADIEARYKEISSRPTFGEYMARTHMSVEDIKDGLKTEMSVNNVIAKEANLTDAEMRAFYKKQSDPATPNALYYTPPTVSLAIISTPSRQQAQRAQQALQQRVEFAKVAAKYSIDESKDRGGVLAPIVRGRSLHTQLPGFENLVFGMRTGEQAGPVQFGPLWCIIRCLDSKPGESMPLEKVAYECRAQAALAKLTPAQRQKMRDDYTKYHENSKIHTFWVQYKNVLGGR